jgi:hypothetical protein
MLSRPLAPRFGNPYLPAMLVLRLLCKISKTHEKTANDKICAGPHTIPKCSKVSC